jgi:hypothetical protein
MYEWVFLGLGFVIGILSHDYIKKGLKELFGRLSK